MNRRHLIPRRWRRTEPPAYTASGLACYTVEYHLDVYDDVFWQGKIGEGCTFTTIVGGKETEMSGVITAAADGRITIEGVT